MWFFYEREERHGADVSECSATGSETVAASSHQAAGKTINYLCALLNVAILSKDRCV